MAEIRFLNEFVHLAAALWGSKNKIISNYIVQDNMCMSHLIASENNLIYRGMRSRM